MSQIDTKLVLIDSLYRQYDLGHRRVDSAVFKQMVKSQTDNKVYRAFRKLHLSSPLPGKSLWLGDWSRDLDAAGTVVLADGGNSENVARLIHYKYPEKRIVLWYRNSIEASGEPSKDIMSFCELWSFDHADCERYGFRYNPQFYGGNPSYEPHELEWDVFFVGQDKGRKDQLLRIETRLREAGLSTRFCIVGYNSGYLSYEQVLDFVSRSRAILDVQASWQDGMTLRPLEALFYRKKLITNSGAYAKSDLYDGENSFVLDRDDWADIRDFVRSDYVVAPNRDALIHEYGIEGWLERFDISPFAEGGER